jgi:predicted Zn-dependent protease
VTPGGIGAGLLPAAEVADEALRRAAGDDGCIVIVEDTAEAELRFANNTTTTNGVRRDRQVTVVALRATAGGLATGIAQRGGAVDVGELVGAAESDAAGAPAADDAAPLLDGPVDPDFEAPPGTTDLSVLSGVVRGLGPAFARARDAGRVLAGFAEHGVSTVYVASSAGLRRRWEQPTGALHLVARSADGRRSAWVGRGTADFADVTVEALESRLAERLAWAERQIDLEAGRYEVVLPPEAVADLMVGAVDAFGGLETEEGRTVFSRPNGATALGEVLAPLPFELRSDPAEPGLECTPFVVTSASGSEVSVFDNGLGLNRTTWIEEGRVARLRYHRAGAARSGVPPAPMIDNLVLELPGAVGGVDDLVARTERGLLLTCLWYIREVDPATLLLTGLTRDGVYLIEDGRVTGAVNNFRFNESPIDLLRRASEAGASVRALGREFGEWMNRSAMPALRIPDFNMSTVSQAS